MQTRSSTCLRTHLPSLSSRQFWMRCRRCSWQVCQTGWPEAHLEYNNPFFLCFGLTWTNIVAVAPQNRPSVAQVSQVSPKCLKYRPNRPSVAQVSPKPPKCLKYRPSISLKYHYQVSPLQVSLCRPSAAQVPPKCRPSVAQVSPKCRPSVAQVSPKCRPSVAQVSPSSDCRLFASEMRKK